MDSFGERVYKKRREFQLSQDALADKVGVKSGKQTVSKWEKNTGNPSLKELISLAAVLKTTVSWLVEGVDSDKSVVASETPPGYILMEANEVIELQRQVLKKQSEIEELKAKEDQSKGQ